MTAAQFPRSMTRLRLAKPEPEASSWFPGRIYVRFGRREGGGCGIDGFVLGQARSNRGLSLVVFQRASFHPVGCLQEGLVAITFRNGPQMFRSLNPLVSDLFRGKPPRAVRLSGQGEGLGASDVSPECLGGLPQSTLALIPSSRHVSHLRVPARDGPLNLASA